MSSTRNRWGPLRSLLVLAPVLIGGPLWGYRQHHALPEPLTDLTDSLTSLPQISESRILSYAKYLSEDIGYRTVGTREHALGDAWMVQQANAMKVECERLAETQSGRKLECEVWRQEGSGSHRFDMMGKRLYKTYVDLSNIIVRVSNGTPAGKEHAVLVNSHLDSTLPSPGAADDGISVGVMLECMRVLLGTSDWSPNHAIIFLFNNAEESLQDGSHLYSTQHPTASTVRAVINLEAAGNEGRELLFQATSEQMIQAYAHVPRPFGTIFAHEIFSSGVLLSECVHFDPLSMSLGRPGTRKIRFEYYLNVTGLDMAVVGNSYHYHMRKDLVENIQPGVAQHMGENVLALLRHLSSHESPLPSLTSGYTPPKTVFFYHLGHFFIYSFATATILYGLTFLSSVILVTLIFVEPAPALRKGNGVWREQGRGLVAVIAGILGSVTVPNIVAAIMHATGNGMSWFAHPSLPMALYGPAGLLGALASQLPFAQRSERTMFSSLLLAQSGAAFIFQFLGIGSSVLFWLSALPLFFSMILNQIVAKEGDTSLWTYAFGQTTPLIAGTLLMVGVCESFVPLTGRIGADVPADHIIASIVSLMGAAALPLVLPFAHRFGRRVLLRAVILFSGITALAMAFFAMRVPFDQMHQQRLFVLHLENITTQEVYLHVSTADGAPGFLGLVNDIADNFAVAGTSPESVVMDEYNGDWDSLYPFSSFLSPYKMQLPVDPEYVSPWASGELFSVTALNDVVDRVAGTRSMTIQIYHPGVIWTVIAFDAHILKWNLDDNPPDEFVRHHIKEGSFYGTDVWSIDVVFQLPSSEPDDRVLRVNYVGIQESGMWPGKRAEKEKGGRAMKLFEELDDWLDVKTGGTVDALLLGCVGGVINI